MAKKEKVQKSKRSRRKEGNEALNPPKLENKMERAKRILEGREKGLKKHPYKKGMNFRDAIDRKVERDGVLEARRHQRKTILGGDGENYFDDAGWEQKGSKLTPPGTTKKPSRTITDKQSRKDWDAWSEFYDEEIKGSDLVAPKEIETRKWSPGYGKPRPAIYSGKSGPVFSNDLREKEGSLLMPEEETKKYFTDYFNKIQPEGLEIERIDSKLSPTATGRTMGNSRGFFSDDLNPEIRISNTERTGRPETAVHELTHTMQNSGKGRPEKEVFNNVGKYETPAMLAGHTIRAMQIEERRDNPLINSRSREEKSLYGLDDHEKVSSSMMARQGMRHMFGKDPVTGEDTAQARHMTELLTTTEGRQFLKRLNTKVSPEEQKKRAESERKLAEEREAFELDLETKDMIKKVLSRGREQP
tara:strand:- start:124 stop:1371 length:1248 start_codon:yes stop_codon:yes gene_type:complete